MQGFFIPETSDKAAAYLRCSNETKTITVKGNPGRILAYMETQRNSNLCPNLQALETRQVSDSIEVSSNCISSLFDLRYRQGMWDGKSV